MIIYFRQVPKSRRKFLDFLRVVLSCKFLGSLARERDAYGRKMLLKRWADKQADSE